MAKVLNLDEVVAEEVTVVLDKKELILPGELPLSLMLELIKIQQGLSEMDETSPDSDVLKDAFELIYKALLMKNEKLDRKWFFDSMTLPRFQMMMAAMQGDFGEEEKKTVEESEKQET